RLGERSTQGLEVAEIGDRLRLERRQDVAVPEAGVVGEGVLAHARDDDASSIVDLQRPGRLVRDLLRGEPPLAALLLPGVGARALWRGHLRPAGPAVAKVDDVDDAADGGVGDQLLDAREILLEARGDGLLVERRHDVAGLEAGLGRGRARADARDD